MRSSCSSLSQLPLRALPTGGWCWVFFSNFTPAWPFSDSALWSIFHSQRCIHVQRRRIWDQVHDFYPILPGFHCFCFKTDMVPEDIRYDSVDQHFEVVQHIYTWVVSLSHTSVTLNWERDLDAASIEAAAPTDIPSPACRHYDYKAAADGSDWKPCPWKWLVSVWITKLFQFVAQPHNCKPWHKGGGQERTIWSGKESGSHKSWQQCTLKLA